MARRCGLAVTASFCVFFLGSVFAQLFVVPGEKRRKGIVAIKAARIIDGTGSEPIRNGVVVIKDDLIIAVGPAASVSIPAGARIIDLGDATLLPGFIDAHTHIVGRTLGDPEGQNASVHDYDSFGAI